MEDEQKKEMIRKFTNGLAFDLPASNDIMQAIRLLREELPALLEEAFQAGEKSGAEKAKQNDKLTEEALNRAESNARWGV